MHVHPNYTRSPSATASRCREGDTAEVAPQTTSGGEGRLFTGLWWRRGRHHYPDGIPIPMANDVPNCRPVCSIWGLSGAVMGQGTETRDIWRKRNILRRIIHVTARHPTSECGLWSRVKLEMEMKYEERARRRRRQGRRRRERWEEICGTAISPK